MRAKYFVVGAMVVLLLALPSAFAVAQTENCVSDGICRFDLVRWDPNYTANMKIALDRIGGGENSWAIPTGETRSFNETVGPLTEAAGFYSVLVGGQWIPAAGACDVASFFYFTGVMNGLEGSPTQTGHPDIPGIDDPNFRVWIWNPGKDVTISNPLDHDVIFRWEITSDDVLEMWVEGGVLPLQSTPMPNGIAENPVIVPVDLRFLNWGLIGIILLVVLLVFFWIRKPRNLARAVYAAGEAVEAGEKIAPKIKKVFGGFLKRLLRWWVFWITVAITLGPEVWRQLLREGLLNFWDHGWVQISGKTFIFIWVALLIDLARHQIWSKKLPESGGMNPKKITRSSKFGRVILIVVVLVIVATVLVAWMVIGPAPVVATPTPTLTVKVGDESAWEIISRAVADEDLDADPGLIYAIWLTETGIEDCQPYRDQAGWNPCRSTAGAIGPLQFMPTTWPSYSEPEWDVWDLHDASRAATRMTRALGLFDQVDRESFACRFSGCDGGQVWNTSYAQGLQVWDLWHR